MPIYTPMEFVFVNIFNMLLFSLPRIVENFGSREIGLQLLKLLFLPDLYSGMTWRCSLFKGKVPVCKEKLNICLIGLA